MRYLLIFILLWSQYSMGESEEKSKSPKVFTSKLELQDVVSRAEYLGKVEPSKSVHIYSPIEGIVTKIPYQAGEKVNQGAVLMEVKQNEVGLVMRPVKLRAPFTGYLYKPYVEENNWVNKNDKLVTLFDPSRFKVEINASPDDSEHIQLKQTVQLELSKKERVLAQVISISPNVDIQTGTRRMVLQFDRPKALSVTPGEIAKATFTFNSRKSFLVDKHWLKKQGDRTFLRLVQEDLKVREVDVKVGEKFKEQQEVFIKEEILGQQIVTKSSVEPLRPDQVVEVVTKNDQLSEEEKSEKTKLN